MTPWPEQPGRLEQSNRETIADLTGIDVLTLAEIDLGQVGDWPRLDLI